MKVGELLKEFQLDYSAALVKLVEDTVSTIKKAIKLIPEDLKVVFLSIPAKTSNNEWPLCSSFDELLNGLCVLLVMFNPTGVSHLFSLHL